MTNNVHEAVLSGLSMVEEELENVGRFLNEEVASLSVADTVDAFHRVKSSGKVLEEAEKLLKLSLTDFREAGVGETTPTGAVQLVGRVGKVEARPRVTAQMDAAKMEAFLKTQGVYADAVDTFMSVNDAAGLKETLETLEKELRLLGGPAEALAGGLAWGLIRHFKIAEAVNEKKVEKLVKAGKLDAHEAAANYSTSTSYALYDVTNT